MKRRGLTTDPRLAVGYGALGFWKALPQCLAKPVHSAARVHKIATVLNKLPKHLQPKAKLDLPQIWMADTRENAHLTFDRFVQP